MNQTGSTQSTEGQGYSQSSSVLITDIETDHSHNADDQTFNSDLGKEVFGKDRLVHRSWFIVHNLRIMRFQSQGDSRKTVCQKVDKQQVYRRERYGKSGQGSIENRQDTCKVSGKKELDRTLNVLVYVPPVFYSFYDSSKVIVRKYHRGGVLGNL